MRLMGIGGQTLSGGGGEELGLSGYREEEELQIRGDRHSLHDLARPSPGKAG